MTCSLYAVVALLFLTALVSAEVSNNGAESYIVRLKSHGLAEHFATHAGPQHTGTHELRRRGLDGARTSHRLDARSLSAVTFTGSLKGEQLAFVARAEEKLGTTLTVRHHYVAGFNGVSLVLTPRQVKAVKSMAEVERVFAPAQRKPLTDASPEWIGAPSIWNGTAMAGGIASEGDGIVIGVIDTGINPLNPSFLDTDRLGYKISNPRGKYYGVCDPENEFYNSEFPCNDKLIGAYGYALGPSDPIDYDGHGSHTAGTAGGNKVATTLYGTEYKISGVAPHANIIAYAACCNYDDIAAAIDQAILDNVDVINYSIGNFPGTIAPFLEADTLGFLNARAAGLFVATGAGNDGPAAFTVGGPADVPWLTSAGAVTSNRQLLNGVDDFAVESSTEPLPAAVVGMGLSDPLAAPVPIVWAGEFLNAAGEPNALCGVFANETAFAGRIVLCDRGEFGRVEKAENVLAAGAGGFILANDIDSASSLEADVFPLPGVHISHADGIILKAWIAGSVNPTAGISGVTRVINDAAADVLADFSSVGPSRAPPVGAANGLRDLIAPSIVAPGVAILAAAGSYGDIKFDVFSGTSMASPHLAGSAALLISTHAEWTPSMVESAILSTGADGVKAPDGVTPATVYQRGGGSVRVAAADRVGLVLSEDADSFYCLDAGLPATSLNRAQLARYFGTNSTPLVSWERTFTAVVDGKWDVTGQNEAGSECVVLSASPSKFKLKEGKSVTVTMTADTTCNSELSSFWFVFTPRDASVATTRLPGAVYKAADVKPNDFSLFTFTASRTSGSSKGDLLADTSFLRQQFRTNEVIRSRPTVMSEVTASPLVQPDLTTGFHDVTTENLTAHTYYSFDNITRKFSMPARTACVVNAVASSQSTEPDVELFVGYGNSFDLGYGYDYPYYIYGDDYLDGVVCASKFVHGQVNPVPPVGVTGDVASCQSIVVFNTGTTPKAWWAGAYQENADEQANIVTLDVDALFCVSLDNEEGKSKRKSLKVMTGFGKDAVIPALENFQPTFKWNKKAMSEEKPLWTSLVQWDSEGKPDSYSLVVAEFTRSDVRKTMTFPNPNKVCHGDYVEVKIEIDTTVVATKDTVKHVVLDYIPSGFKLIGEPVCELCSKLTAHTPGEKALRATIKSAGCAMAKTVEITYTMKATRDIVGSGIVEFKLKDKVSGWPGAKTVRVNNEIKTCKKSHK